MQIKSTCEITPGQKVRIQPGLGDLHTCRFHPSDGFLIFVEFLFAFREVEREQKLNCIF